MTPAQADLFDTGRPELTGEASANQPEPQRGPDQDASQQLGDTAPASLAAGFRPVIDPAKRPGPFDCSIMKRYPGKARNIPRELDEQERQAQASEERRKTKTGHQAGRSSRQIAQDVAEANGEAPTESQPEDI